MKSLWILSEQRRLEVQKTLDTLTQTSDFDSCEISTANRFFLGVPTLPRFPDFRL